MLVTEQETVRVYRKVLNMYEVTNEIQTPYMERPRKVRKKNGQVSYRPSRLIYIYISNQCVLNRFQMDKPMSPARDLTRNYPYSFLQWYMRQIREVSTVPNSTIFWDITSYSPLKVN
jgi:hypothetical protein